MKNILIIPVPLIDQQWAKLLFFINRTWPECETWLEKEWNARLVITGDDIQIHFESKESQAEFVLTWL
jgi:hypothetical protein